MICELTYCEHHRRPGGAVAIGGHYCTGNPFPRIFRESIDLPISGAKERIYTLAKISNNVYHLNNQDYPSMDEGCLYHVLFSQLEIGLDDYECIRDSCVLACEETCGMAVWRNKRTDLRILAIKGTDKSNRSDVFLCGGMNIFIVILSHLD